jgi:hypothetical protein
MINFLKLSSFIFLGIGVLFSLGIFALKIFFYDDFLDVLIVLGPDKHNVISKPSDPKGFKVPNLDIEILNNKKALIENKKLRSLPVKPELLPIEVIEEINKQGIINNKIKTKENETENKPQTKSIKKPEFRAKLGLYRVQFGSFRNLEKAKTALKSMNQQHKLLLSEVNLEIFTFENTKKTLFHRVWTSPITKKNGLKLCDKFKLKKIICILQPNK